MSEYQTCDLLIEAIDEEPGGPLTEEGVELVRKGWEHGQASVQPEITTLRQQLEQAQAESVQAAANKVCGELPEGWVINLCMENGAAWVEAIKPSGYTIDIDRGDLSLAEQVGEALRLANEIEKAGGEQ